MLFCHSPLKSSRDWLAPIAPPDYDRTSVELVKMSEARVIFNRPLTQIGGLDTTRHQQERIRQVQW